MLCSRQWMPCGGAASARWSLSATAASPRGRGSHTHSEAALFFVGAPPRRDGAFDRALHRREGAAPTSVLRLRCFFAGAPPRRDGAFDRAPHRREGAAPTPILRLRCFFVGAPPRRDGAFDRAPHRREGAAPTPILRLRCFLWERRLGAMGPLIEHCIAARARLPHPF
jgi:hypothetical protein